MAYHVQAELVTGVLDVIELGDRLQKRLEEAF